VRWGYQFLFRWSALCEWLPDVLQLLLSGEIRRETFGLYWRFVWISLAPAENSNLWFLSLSYFVRVVTRTLVLEFLSCRASPLAVLKGCVLGVWRAVKRFRPKPDLSQNVNGLSCHFLSKTKNWPVDSWRNEALIIVRLLVTIKVIPTFLLDVICVGKKGRLKLRQRPRPRPPAPPSVCDLLSSTIDWTVIPIFIKLSVRLL
jgi:hypothetical protein